MMRCHHLLLLAFVLGSAVVHASQASISTIDGRGMGGRGMGGRGGAMGHSGHGGAQGYGQPGWMAAGQSGASASVFARISEVESDSHYVDRKLLRHGGMGGRGMGGHGGASGGHGGVRSYAMDHGGWMSFGRTSAAASVAARFNVVEAESRYVNRKLLKNAGPESWQYTAPGNMDLDTRWGWVKQTVRRGAISGPGASALATGVDPRFETRGIN